MSKGFVYILSNPSMPGIVKIGKTTRTVEGRAAELYQTGVPTPFEIVHSVLSPDCHQLEADIHAVFAPHRVGAGREFFAIEPERAIMQLDAQNFDAVTDWVDEFLPDHMPVHRSLMVDDGTLALLCHRLDAAAPMIIDAIAEMRPEELAPALLRVEERIARRMKERAAHVAH